MVHGAKRPFEGAPTREELATAMGHAPSTAMKHYDRTKPQRDAQRAVNGMQALRNVMRANVVRVDVAREEVAREEVKEDEVEMEDDIELEIEMG